MIKRVTKYILSFCILLLGGYSQAHGGQHTPGAYHFSSDRSKGIEIGYASINALEKCAVLHIKPPSCPHKEKQHHKHNLLFENEETSEETSFKKYLKKCALAYSGSFGLSPFLQNNNQENAFPRGEFYSLSSHRFLLFKVFRI